MSIRASGSFDSSANNGSCRVAQRLLHVGRGRIGAFRPAPRQLVEDRVEDVEPEVAEAQVVQVGKHQGDAQLDVLAVLVDRVQFRPEVTGRLGDVREDVGVQDLF